jgi:hypothetical protein
VTLDLPQKKVKNISSDTDLYLNLLANDNKKLQNSTEKSSSLSDLLKSEKNDKTSSIKSKSSVKSSSSKKSSSKPVYQKIDLSKNTNYSNDNNSSYNSYANNIKIEKNLNPKELRMKKIDLLRKLSEIKSKGYELSKSYDLNSSLEEMQYEYELLKSFANKRNGIKLYKNILLNVTSVVEFLNDKYDPFSFKLSGWSEHMSVEVDSYDDVLEELYEKYKGTGKGMPPEIKLLLLILASASAFHFSKSTFSKVPGLNGILKSNPGLVANMINPKKKSSRFMSEQEINLEKQREAAIKRERETKKGRNDFMMEQQRMMQRQQMQQQQMQQQQMQQQQMQQQQMQQQQMQQQQMQQQQMQQQMMEQKRQEELRMKQESRKYQNAQSAFASADFSEKVDIKEPENVEDIIKRLHERASDGNMSGPGGTTTQEESSNNNRIVSDTTLTEDTQGQKVSRRKRRKKKELITIM